MAQGDASRSSTLPTELPQLDLPSSPASGHSGSDVGLPLPPTSTTNTSQATGSAGPSTVVASSSISSRVSTFASSRGGSRGGSGSGVGSGTGVVGGVRQASIVSRESDGGSAVAVGGVRHSSIVSRESDSGSGVIGGVRQGSIVSRDSDSQASATATAGVRVGSVISRESSGRESFAAAAGGVRVGSIISRESSGRESFAAVGALRQSSIVSRESSVGGGPAQPAVPSRLGEGRRGLGDMPAFQTAHGRTARIHMAAAAAVHAVDTEKQLGTVMPLERRPTRHRMFPRAGAAAAPPPSGLSSALPARPKSFYLRSLNTSMRSVASQGTDGGGRGNYSMVSRSSSVRDREAAYVVPAMPSPKLTTSITPAAAAWLTAAMGAMFAMPQRGPSAAPSPRTPPATSPGTPPSLGAVGRAPSLPVDPTVALAIATAEAALWCGGDRGDLAGPFATAVATVIASPRNLRSPRVPRPWLTDAEGGVGSGRVASSDLPSPSLAASEKAALADIESAAGKAAEALAWESGFSRNYRAPLETLPEMATMEHAPSVVGGTFGAMGRSPEQSVSPPPPAAPPVALAVPAQPAAQPATPETLTTVSVTDGGVAGEAIYSPFADMAAWMNLPSPGAGSPGPRVGHLPSPK